MANVSNARLNLLDLDDDVLSLIIDTLLKTETHDLADTLVFSELSQRSRRLACSLIFRDVQWPLRNRVEFHPVSLWPYISMATFRRLSFLQVQWLSRHMKACDTLAKILPQLPNLIAFNYTAQTFLPNPSFVSALATVSATLTTLELTTVFFSHDALPLFSRYSGLHRIVINQPDRSTLLSATESKRKMSIQCVANLIFACQGSLSHLELPGEFCPMEAFGSGAATFPVLKTLILRGYPPLDAGQFPAWKILRSMPRLHRLEIHCRLRIKGANAHRYTLMPQDASPAPGEAFLFPSQLEALTISNPSLNDHIFKRLPPSLKYLFLDFVPDWENMLSSKDSLAYHRPTVMKTFLSMMHKCHGSSGISSIENLCIKMGWCATPDILGCISLLFPNLKAVELQGLRYVDRATEPASNMESCISNLAHLHHLRTLKIAVELQEDPYEYTMIGGARNVGSVNQSAQRWADTLALRLSNLESLAFETRPHTGRGLGPRVLIGRPSWMWFSRGDGILGSSIMYRVSVSDESTSPAEEPESEIRRKFPQEPPPAFSPSDQTW